MNKQDPFAFTNDHPTAMEVPVFLDALKTSPSAAGQSPRSASRARDTGEPESSRMPRSATATAASQNVARSDQTGDTVIPPVLARTDPEPQHRSGTAAPANGSLRNPHTSKPSDIPIPEAFTRQDPPDSTCILSLVHLQKLEIEVGTDGAAPNVFSGQLDETRWNAIRLVPTALRRALSTAGVVDAESLIDRTALLRIGEKWNPAVRMLVLGTLDDDASAKVWSVCEAVLSALTQAAQERANLKIDNLDPVAQAAVRESVEAAIEGSRGCSFGTPLVVQGRNGPELQLRGKLGRKRDKSNHAAKAIDLTGRIGGFFHFAKVHYFTLHPLEGSEVRIDFRDEQLRAEDEPDSPTTLSLVEIARMNDCRALCAIRAHKTQDAHGCDVYSFSRMLPPPDKSPVAESTIMTNANTATNS